MVDRSSLTSIEAMADLEGSGVTLRNEEFAALDVAGAATTAEHQAAMEQFAAVEGEAGSTSATSDDADSRLTAKRAAIIASVALARRSAAAKQDASLALGRKATVADLFGGSTAEELRQKQLQDEARLAGKEKVKGFRMQVCGTSQMTNCSPL